MRKREKREGKGQQRVRMEGDRDGAGESKDGKRQGRGVKWRRGPCCWDYLGLMVSSWGLV